MMYYVAKKDGAHRIPATCKEEAWTYSRSSLKVGEYVFSVSEKWLRYLPLYTRKGHRIYDESGHFYCIGAVVAYCNIAGRVSYVEPSNADS